MHGVRALLVELDKLERAQGDPERWVEVAQEILDLQPDRDELWVKLADHFQRRGEWERALAEWEAMVAANPQSPIAERGVRTARRVAERGEARAARRNKLTEQIESAGDYSELIEIGLRSRRSGEIANATRAFDRAVELAIRDQDPREISEVALGLRRARVFEVALPLMQYAVRELNDSPSLVMLAKTYRSLGRLADAEATYQQARRLEDSKYARIGVGGVFRDLGRNDEAEAMARSVLAENPDDPFALMLLAPILARQAVDDPSKLAEATESYERATRLGVTVTRDGRVSLMRLLERLRAERGKDDATKRIERLMAAFPPPHD